MTCAPDCRRQFERKLVRETVSVSWLDRQGAQKFYSTYSFDVSTRGLSVHVAEPIPIESYVALRSAKLKLIGRAVVRNSVRRNSGYRIGVEFVEETPVAAGCKDGKF